MMWQFPKYRIGEALDWDDFTHTYTWIADMQGVPQDPLWHAEGDVHTHTRMVVQELLQLPDFETLPDQQKHLLFTAALLHDVEKRSTTTREVIDGVERIVSPRHAKKGEYTSRQLLYREMPTPFYLREQICKLVRLHGLPLWAIDRTDPAKEVIYASTVVDTRLLALLARADIIGRMCNDRDELLYKIELFEELCREQECFGQPRQFGSDYGRYLYFNRQEAHPDYVPYDDTICTVTMLCGLPGSGKDTYIRRYLDQPVLSLDDLRRSHGISPTDKKGNGQVIQLGKEQARVYLRAKTSFTFNATNITRDMRARWIGLFTEYKAHVRIVYIEVPYRTLLKQNANRPHPVPTAVLERLLGKLEMPDVREAHEVMYLVE